MSEIFKRLIGNKLAKASLVLIFIQVFTLFISFGGNIYLANIYDDPSGFGEFNYYFSLITTLGYSASFGLDTFLLKKNTELQLTNDHSSIKELLIKSLHVTIVFSLLVAIVLFLCISKLTTEINVIHIWVCFGVFFTALLTLRSCALRSLGGTVMGNFFSQSGKTWFFYIFVLLLSFVWLGLEFNLGVIAFVIATLCSWLGVEYFLLKKVDTKIAPGNNYTYLALLKLGFYFLLFDLVGNFSMNVDIFMIEKLSTNFYLGNYAFYKKLCMIPFMAVAVVGAVLQPKYIEMFHSEQKLELQSFVRKSNFFLFLFSVVVSICLIFLFFNLKHLHIVFAQFFHKYEQYQSYLWYFSAIEIVCALFGPNLLFMAMLGMEKVSVYLEGAFIVGLLFLSLLFVHLFGNEGFIISYGICKLLKNILAWFWIKKKTDISFFIV